MLRVGDIYETTFIITRLQEQQFMDLTGDVNPIHLNADAARAEGYQAPIVHGMLVASIIGKVIGMEFPGQGTVNIHRAFDFIRTMFVDERYILRLRITNIDIATHIAEMKFSIKNSNNKVCLTGFTRIKNGRKFAD